MRDINNKKCKNLGAIRKKCNISNNAKRSVKVRNAIICGALLCVGVAIISTLQSNPKLEIAVKKVEDNQQAITIKTREKNSNNYVAVISEDNLDVPVPKGYVASPDVEERYVNGVTTDGVREHHGGFVIYERLARDEGKTDAEVQAIIEEDMDVAQRTRNQWVWVPIADVTDMYHVSNNQLYANQYTFSASSYNKETNKSLEPALQTNPSDSSQFDYEHIYLKRYLDGISRNELLQEMREEFCEMLESVKTYEGFYIGRYETGNTQKNNLRVVKGFTGTTGGGNSNNRINFITWYTAYKRSKQMRGTNPVYTNLIWGIQWDETLKWLIDSGEKTYSEVGSNSSSWGNYNGVSFTYTRTSGVTTDGLGTEAGGIATKSISSGIIPTGSTERNEANNIYDLAGNVWEWTMGYNGSFFRYSRGGGFNGNGSNTANHRYNSSTNGSGWDLRS